MPCTKHVPLSCSLLARRSPASRKITSGSAQDHCRRVWKTDTGYALGGANGELIPINGLN